MFITFLQTDQGMALLSPPDDLNLEFDDIPWSLCVYSVLHIAPEKKIFGLRSGLCDALKLVLRLVTPFPKFAFSQSWAMF